jgi:hypothetical protein
MASAPGRLVRGGGTVDAARVAFAQMEIELSPDPEPDDAAADAALRALAREGLAEEPVPPGLASAWRRAGLDQAMDRELDPRGRATGNGGRPPSPRRA